MAMIDRDLAGNGTEGSINEIQLYAGESDIVTTAADAAAATTWAKYTVLALVAGLLVPVDPAGSGAAAIAYAIAAQPKVAGTAVHAEPIFVGGVFNHAALVWPAAWDTFYERQAAFAGSNITINKQPV
jgi:hypothetical protein